MKTGILTLTQGSVSDNEDYISGNVAEYLINEARIDENYFFWYLSDEEIKEIEENDELRSKKWNEVVDFLKENFNYKIKKFEIIKENGFLAGANECLIIKFEGGGENTLFSTAVELVQEYYPNAKPQSTDWQDEDGNIDQYGEYLFFE